MSFPPTEGKGSAVAQRLMHQRSGPASAQRPRISAAAPRRLQGRPVLVVGPRTSSAWSCSFYEEWRRRGGEGRGRLVTWPSTRMRLDGIIQAAQSSAAGNMPSFGSPQREGTARDRTRHTALERERVMGCHTRAPGASKQNVRRQPGEGVRIRVGGGGKDDERQWRVSTQHSTARGNWGETHMCLERLRGKSRAWVCGGRPRPCWSR